MKTTPFKRIKFSIDVNGKQVRSLEDLETQFHLQDVYDLYSKGVLSRWLEAHGLEKKRDELAAIPDSPDDMRQTAEQLVRLFCPGFPEKSMQESLCYLHFREKEAETLRKLEKLKMARDKVINEYHAGYEQLKIEIVKNALDLPYISHAARTLVKQYWKLVELEWEVFWKRMCYEAPGIFLPLLALDKIRGFQDTCREIKKHIASCSAGKNEQNILRAILQGKTEKKQNIDGKEQTTEIEYNTGSLKVLNKSTHESWDDIVPDTSAKIMVIYLAEGNFVRSRREREELNAEHVNITFPILEGLDYKGLKPGPLIYLDVTDLQKKIDS